ncbi:haloacid dehalogenase [Polyplosphaeria fusca]|uniref:Haloacid dehalogenase n=1 Tax=Polyplosphaeria fusca TaxID=682080 RepID=A0A9P4UYU9_9PLEO|nr:haloacid dehalogenase [Polyplosphaeria fusca]
MSDKIVLAFDVYGTLLSTESIAKQLAEHFGEEKANKIATEWRRYQLEYTWRLNSMEKYEPFSTITLKSLHHALSSLSLSLPSPSISTLMSSYTTLSLFPDVPPLFPALRSTPTMHPVLFSNGTHDMVHASLTQSPDLAPHADLFQDIVVVDDMPGEKKRFKPVPGVYRWLCERVGKEGREGEVWLVSGNAFDVVGANAVGMRTCWVDRGGGGWVDALGGEEGRPTVIVKGVGEVVERVERFVSMGE